MVINETLKWDSHVDRVIARVRRGVGALSLVSRSLSESVRLIIFHAIVQAHLSYGVALYGGAPSSTLEPLNVLQRRGLRAVLGVATGDIHNVELLRMGSGKGVASIRQMRWRSLLACTDDWVGYLAPYCHGRGTRGDGQWFEVPRSRTLIGERARSHLFPKFFNLLGGTRVEGFLRAGWGERKTIIYGLIDEY
uniref:RNA-directed DNA polymerase from mobile element jockey n=1 Tax=Lygus hesperus TaxID=30085 RepID=A0A0K8SMH1_LYGHE